MNKHKGNNIKIVKKKKKLLPKSKQKNHGKMKQTHPTRLHFLGSAMNGNKKKKDENQIKNPNPNPNREKREKRAIERNENKNKEMN